MKLILVENNKTQEAAVYLRTVIDQDEDISVEVSNNPEFANKEVLGFFSLNNSGCPTGKLRFYRYSDLKNDSELVSVEDGQIEVQ